MSEIKGQLLGMLMVLILFGAVAGVMYGLFNSSAQKISSAVSSETSFVTH